MTVAPYRPIDYKQNPKSMFETATHYGITIVELNVPLIDEAFYKWYKYVKQENVNPGQAFLAVKLEYKLSLIQIIELRSMVSSWLFTKYEPTERYRSSLSKFGDTPISMHDLIRVVENHLEITISLFEEMIEEKHILKK